jgi:glycerophosphoryl diester phosphodiesterase
MQPLVAAHRGYHAEAPENSLAALRAAASLGADLVELDVRHTADGELILMHDDTLDRTTDGTGLVSEWSWAELQALRLKEGDPLEDEACRIPRFADALALADELGLALYVDQKTDATALVLAAVQAGSYQRLALIRDDLQPLVPMAAEDPALLVMPAVGSVEELEEALVAIPGLLWVELSAARPDVEIIARAAAAGVRVQQDVMASGDSLAAFGDYSGYWEFLEEGVVLLQTEFPELLVPAIRELHETGRFPLTGPGKL